MRETARIKVKLASSEADYAAFVEILREYVDELSIDFCFYDLDDELEAPRTRYGEPAGAAWLSLDARGVPTGIIAVRALGGGIAEVKRMFVRPAHRGSGAGRLLCEAAVDHARAAGFCLLRLDSAERLAPAVRLYERLGFSRIPAYNENPEPDAVFFEMVL